MDADMVLHNGRVHTHNDRLPVGGDLYRTSNGVYWEPVFADGLGNSDNHSIRTLKSTDLGLFVGTENPFTQLEV